MPEGDEDRHPRANPRAEPPSRTRRATDHESRKEARLIRVAWLQSLGQVGPQGQRNIYTKLGGGQTLTRREAASRPWHTSSASALGETISCYLPEQASKGEQEKAGGQGAETSKREI